MTGLIYNKPEDPLDFLESAIAKIRTNPELALKWDTFIDTENGPNSNGIASTGGARKSSAKKPKKEVSRSGSQKESSSRVTSAKHTPGNTEMPSAGRERIPSVTKAAEVARIPPDVPIILFIGGPGGGKTRIAARVRDSMEAEGLVHICMPDLVKTAISKYKDRFPEWKDAAEKYQRGELIPNHLAEDIVKAEMGRHPYAKAYFLEGFPREARQVEDFERNVRAINMALILDYDEETLRRHMQSRGLPQEVMDRRISEFKQKTLPSAKYFDDQRLLHLIPGEKEDNIILERMRKLITRAIELGVPVYNSATNTPEVPPVQPQSASPENTAPVTVQTPSPVKPPNSNSRVSGGSAKTSPPPQTPQTPHVPQSPQVVQANIHPLSVPVVASTIPPTPSGSENEHPKPQSSSTRPSTNLDQKENSPPQIQSPPVENGRPPSSVVSTPKLVDGPFKESLETPSESKNPNDPRALTANADKFPKGLPNNCPVVLIIGGPGSNKSEIAKKVATKYDGFKLFSMGDLLRKKVMQNVDDELWQRIGKKMDFGEMIPVQICREVLYTALHEHGGGSWGYVIEGYPRTQKQVEDLEQQLGRVDVGLLIDCTEQYCKENLSKRLKEGLENGNERKDDSEEVVKTRLGLFKQNTLPMLKYLDDKNKLKVVRVRSKKVGATF
ncbi:hypothetical protein FO519_004802 [Halicephalobus sp. NKZ332]|nr:hypothetical protein FO519_004802 [Halicephalobus sp. NKZ332]